MEIPERYVLKLLKEIEPPDASPQGEEWLHELKWDGDRTPAYARELGARATLLARNGQDRTKRYGIIADQVPKVFPGHTFVSDGELTATDGVRHGRDLMPKKAGGQLLYVVFDLLEWDGEPLVEEPLEARREIMEEHFEQQSNIILSPTFNDPRIALEVAIKNKGEGTVSKLKSSPYHQDGDRRDGDWLKMRLDVYARKHEKYKRGLRRYR